MIHHFLHVASPLGLRVSASQQYLPIQIPTPSAQCNVEMQNLARDHYRPSGGRWWKSVVQDKYELNLSHKSIRESKSRRSDHADGCDVGLVRIG